MDIHKLLTIKGIFKGNSDAEFQYYQMPLVDNEGKEYLTTIGCKLIHTTSCEKAFSKLILVSAPTDKELLEAQPKDVKLN